jgi:cbb3-type cytochrome oxidase subunit 3
MNLDVNDLRILVTVTGLALFVALVVHTYSRKRAHEHAAAARLPFDGEPTE